MAIAQKLAGFSLGQADILRRAMGKKKKSSARQAVRRASRRACSPTATRWRPSTTLWDILLPFSDYAFNKAHTAAYGAHLVLDRRTSRRNYPAEYMAALLTSVGDSKDKSALYLNECRRMGIKVLPPDVNESVGRLRRRRHRHPLRPGRDPQRRRQRRRRPSSAAREDKGRFTSFHDFLRKVPAVVATSARSSR